MRGSHPSVCWCVLVNPHLKACRMSSVRWRKIIYLRRCVNNQNSGGETAAWSVTYQKILVNVNTNEGNPVDRFTVLNQPQVACPPPLLWGDCSPFQRTQWLKHVCCFKSKLRKSNNASTRSPLSSLCCPTTDWLIDWLAQPGRQHHLLPRSTLRHQALLHSHRRHPAPSSPSSSSSSVCSPPHHSPTLPLHPSSGLSSRSYDLSKYNPPPVSRLYKHFYQSQSGGAALVGFS